MFVSVLGVVTITGGCAKFPTEKHAVSDLRPQVSFNADSDIALEARVFVDGLEMGLVDDFREGEAALRVLPGMHVLRVVSGTKVLLEEKVYLGDGVGRVFIVK